jgi:hypothetical protein
LSCFRRHWIEGRVCASHHLVLVSFELKWSCRGSNEKGSERKKSELARSNYCYVDWYFVPGLGGVGQSERHFYLSTNANGYRRSIVYWHMNNCTHK